MTPWYRHFLKHMTCSRFMAEPFHTTLSDRGAQPYDDRELEWLEAFLKACEFMIKMDTMTRAGD